MPDIIREPFGQADCETEVRILKGDYSELYFDETPFNDLAISPETYLIIGRRGSGKTALAQYFSFQKKIPNPLFILVEKPEIYRNVLSQIAALAESRGLAVPRLRDVWEYVLWRVIVEHTKLEPMLNHVPPDSGISGRVSHFVNFVLDGLVKALRGDDSRLDEQILRLRTDKRLEEAKAQALRAARKTPIILAIDTLEQYDISDSALMNALAALVECAAEFNLKYRDEGVHIKLLMSGEVFPYLEEEVLLNTLKSIKNAVYLFWRPKDLLRLISWRFYRYLTAHGLLEEDNKLDWTNHRLVLDKMWTPFFGEFVTNHRKVKEHTFPYVLRHTQMRPRQLIVLCNSIAKHAAQSGTFPRFSEEDIREGIRNAEMDLAKEIINSFSELYPKVSRIVDALMRMPKLFQGNELDRRASESASAWPTGAYSPTKFRHLVAELGIVGRIRRHNELSGFIDADFEYSLKGRLALSHRDRCVIHPMFYTRFQVDITDESRVMPFSTERETHEEDDEFF